MTMESFRTAFLLAALSLATLLAACAAPQPVAPAAPEKPKTAVAATPAFDHAALDQLLAARVNNGGWVDYKGLRADRAKLDAYLNTLATADPAAMAGDAERLAFWINAYNGFTLADALDEIHGKRAGVKGIDETFFRGKKHRVAGQELTLDQIERNGRDLKDPRIHFAVVCASASCPKLQSFAYTGAQLHEQLDNAAREFLADTARGMRLDRERRRVILSPIFKWYAADFTGGAALLARAKAQLSGGEILEYVRKYAAADDAQFIAERNPTVDYLEYDWSLNAQETHP
ncbi:MAG: DUF547 domain-containing protein [Blastocatellia bacterium]